MTILVTGATGLVGTRLLPRLLEAGWNCRTLMRRGKSAPPGVEAAYGDLADPASLVSAVQGVSAILHLAALFRTPDNDAIWRANLDGTRHLIHAAKEHAPAARFIMASTSNIYARNAPRPGREDDPVDPQLAYPASKLAAERELRQSGLNWSILRFGFVYGEADGHLESLPRYVASGQAAFHPAARMSLVHHRDIATAANLALAGALDGHVVNISDDAPTSFFELFELIGVEMQPSSEPLPNPWHLHMDNSRARSLGFYPTIPTVHHAKMQNIF
ncbi:NAD-dependent epimerase/dehydratase family protein [Sphingomonas soli]|uniref:NAD-dependent epimerase/dehydratase family protein n=1 Tax=Sphingomonas soli TaxID=266127 RepID=UPI000834899F|nr:NAD(P)-dependent oxidoreductase [Sphingomonas soli]